MTEGVDALCCAVMRPEIRAGAKPCEGEVVGEFRNMGRGGGKALGPFVADAIS